MLVLKKKQQFLKKQIEETYTLLKENDVISHKFKEKGKDVSEQRNLLKKYKEKVDQINQSLRSSKTKEALMKKFLLDIEGIKNANIKLKEKFLSKIKSIDVKQGEKKIRVDPEKKKKNSIFPNEKEIQEIQKNNKQEEHIRNKKSIQQRATVLQNADFQNLGININQKRNRETKLQWITKLKELKLGVKKYERMLYDAKLIKHEQYLSKYFYKEEKQQQKEEDNQNLQGLEIFTNDLRKILGIKNKDIQINQQQKEKWQQYKKLQVGQKTYLNFTQQKLIKGEI